jgi:cytochrome bd-type quinol oxidase subunit 2
MHIFGENKDKQKLWSRAFIVASFFILLSAGVWIATWGIRGSKTNTVSELGLGKTVKSISILFFLILLIFATFAIVVLKYTDKKWTIRTHTISLYFWAVLFMILAIVIPQQCASAAQGLEEECDTNIL